MVSIYGRITVVKIESRSFSSAEIQHFRTEVQHFRIYMWFTVYRYINNYKVAAEKDRASIFTTITTLTT